MTSEQFLQRFRYFIDAPNGFKKLRELVLQLAVQGKLVDQNINDESGFLLLERIQKEKERLIKEKLTKKIKIEPNPGVNEAPYTIPKNWIWTRLAHAVDVRDGTHDTPKYVTKGIPLVTSKNLSSGRLCLDNIKYISNEDHLKIQERSAVIPGDILFAMIGSIGNPVIVNIDAPFSIKNVALFKPISPDSFCSGFLKYYLEYSAENMRAVSGGGVQSFVSLGFLRNYLLPLPPLAEQNRIVAKVDELMALCDQLEAERNACDITHRQLIRAVHHPLTMAADTIDAQTDWSRIRDNFTNFYTTLESVQALRETILLLALQGKLVKQNQADIPTKELLDEIRKKKEQLISEGKLKKSASLVSTVEEKAIPGIPSSWEIVKFGDVVSMRLGKMLDKSKNKGEPRPYLRNTNVQWQNIDLSDVKEMRFEDSELEEYEVLPGDLLLCEGGEPGRCAIWDGESDRIYFQKALHRVRPYGGILPKFLLLRVVSDTWSGFLSAFYTGATIKHLTGKALASYYLPLPPLAEQHRIVAKADELMALCDQLEVNIKNKSETASRYAEAIVHQIAAA